MLHRDCKYNNMIGHEAICRNLQLMQRHLNKKGRGEIKLQKLGAVQVEEEDEDALIE